MKADTTAEFGDDAAARPPSDRPLYYKAKSSLNQRVLGSSPSASTTFLLHYSDL